MKLLELKDSIVRKVCQKPYVFTGAEIGIMDIYINQIAKTFDRQVVRIASVNEAIIDNRQDTLIKQKDKIYLVKDDKELVKNEEMWDFISDQFSDLYLILVYTSIDGRTAFSKYFQPQTVEFECLDANQLSRYIMKDTGLDIERAKEFAINCGLDYLTCQMEENKLLNYAKVFNLPINKAYDEALKEKVLCIRWDDMFMDFVNSVVNRNIESAMAQWKYLKQYGESEFKAIAFIYTQFKNLLLMKNQIRINPYFENQLNQAVKVYDMEEVEVIVELLQKLEKDVKLGSMDIDILFDYLLCSIG